MGSISVGYFCNGKEEKIRVGGEKGSMWVDLGEMLHPMSIYGSKEQLINLFETILTEVRRKNGEQV